MKATELLNDTLRMLGYSESNGNVQLPQRVRNSAVVTINLVYEDLWNICYDEPFVPIKNFSDEIVLPDKVPKSTVMYGLAMYIAQSENDGDQQQLYAHLYNAGRARLSKIEKVIDKIPRSYD